MLWEENFCFLSAELRGRRTKQLKEIKMKVRQLSKGLLAAIGLGVILLGATVYAAVTVILAVGTIPESELFDEPTKVTVRTLTIPPGEIGAWHYHPGYAFNVVKSGTLTVEDGCGGDDEDLTPGQAFEETSGRVHRAKNLGTVDLVIYNTFLMPGDKPTTRNIPNNERLCGPPETVDECRNDGWEKFNHPRTFRNQGDCISWFRHRPLTIISAPVDPLGEK